MKRLMTVAFFGAFAITARAGVIEQYIAGTFEYASVGYPGESFTTPSVGGPWTDISFNFYSDTAATISAAGGTAFLLSQLYTGTPAALSSASPGFIASATGGGLGGVYAFGTGVILQPNTEYWVVSNAHFQTSGSITAGTPAQFQETTGSATSNFNSFPSQNQNYTLSGGNILSLPGGPTSAPVFLVSSPGVAEVTGTIVGQGSQDYYSFLWGGGAFSATTTITGANSLASYVFSEGTLGGGCTDGSSVTLNNGDTFNGTISFANLAPGQYCIGLNANNSNDPSFALTFSAPVDSVPEPSSVVLLVAGLASLGWLCARRKF